MAEQLETFGMIILDSLIMPYLVLSFQMFEMDANRVSELRGINKKENWTRIDKVQFIDIDREINKLATLSYSVNQLNNSADFNYYLTESNNINYSEWT